MSSVSRPSSPNGVELRCASAFSFLEGASNPEDLAERGAELGYGTIALADRGGLYGIPRFHQAARAAGVEAIVGTRIAVKDGPELLLLVESQRGYRNLSRLLTVAHERGGKSDASATWDEVAEHAADLIALVRGDGSLSRRVTRSDPGRARTRAGVGRRRASSRPARRRRRTLGGGRRGVTRRPDRRDQRRAPRAPVAIARSSTPSPACAIT